ncbi:MAG: glycosyltransferase [Blautia sp.]|nr:glycosyltransferase [Blautia sp.]MCM1200761.1 glycosyltransferase [Bacteroides fragilis]
MKVIVFGVGNYYQIQKPKLKSLSDIEIVAYADNNASLWGTMFDERPVIPPVGILAAAYDKVIIISLYVSEIFNQLIELGVDRGSILSWPHFWSERMKGRIEIFSPEIRQEVREKKILIISNDLNYDGASLAAVYAAEALNRYWSVVLAVPLGNNQLIRETVNAGVTVAVCSALPWFGPVERNWMKQFDAVIVNAFPMIESALEARKFRPVLWWIHERTGNYPIVMRQYPDGLKETEFQNINLFAVSEVCGQIFNRNYPERHIKILPLGIPDKRLDDAESRTQNKKIIFAVIGVVFEVKGQDFFLEAAERIAADADAEFWIIGRMAETGYCRQIREKAETLGSVRIFGELTRDEINKALSEIDVVVCASKEETLSIAIVEGMMSGKACITTKPTGIADYIEDGKNGFVVDYHDVDTLAEKMAWMIENRDRLKEMGMAARETYEKHFSMDAFGKRLKATLLETEKEWKEQHPAERPSQPKVSVILPSLNVAAYIRECIESVLAQTLQDIEVICIDAGSTDGTCEILQEYAAKDSRIRFVPSEKRSYGYQINLGIDMAQGEYLGIVETDDSIAPDMYETLYNAAVAKDLDYAKAGFYTLVTPYEGERYLLEHPLSDTEQIISAQYFMKKNLSPDVYIWNGVYKLSFLREFHIRLNESPGAAFQDCAFRYLVDMNLRRGMFLNRMFYHYRRDNAAASTYNPHFARFNLAECRYIREKMKESGITDRERLAFMARETVMMALSPYTTFREHSLPDGEILSALDEFREIILQDREQGLLKQEEMFPPHWIEMRLFTENPEAYEAYIAVKAKTDHDIYGNFVQKMAEKKQLIVFCTGKAAKFALCLLRMNRLENIAALCDNDSAKWGTLYQGYRILSPEEAVKKYPQAHYIIAKKAGTDEIAKQLSDGGILEENISVYKLPLNAFGSTNLFMRNL